MECWNATIDVDGQVLRPLDGRERNRDGLIGNAQLLENKVDFRRVETLQAPKFERFDLCRHGRRDDAERNASVLWVDSEYAEVEDAKE
jgi:hypothetical protein